jgi:hypothetical protein
VQSRTGCQVVEVGRVILSMHLRSSSQNYHHRHGDQPIIIPSPTMTPQLSLCIIITAPTPTTNTTTNPNTRHLEPGVLHSEEVLSGRRTVGRLKCSACWMKWPLAWSFRCFELWIYLLLRILDAVTLTGHDKHHVPVI